MADLGRAQQISEDMVILPHTAKDTVDFLTARIKK